MDENNEKLATEVEEYSLGTDIDTENTFGEENAPKKSFVLQRTILISAAIVVLFILAAIMCRLFFTNGVTDLDVLGNKASTTWHYAAENPYATSDEASQIDQFLKFEPDGTVKYMEGSFAYTGKYSYQYIEKDPKSDLLKDKAGKVYVYIENTGSDFDGKFFFEESGSAFSEKTLKLTSIYDKSLSYELDRKKSYSLVLPEREDEFEADDDLIGKWTSKNETVKDTIEFNSDGTICITTKKSSEGKNTNFTAKGIYSVKNGKLVFTVSGYGMELQNGFEKYIVSGDTLQLINGNSAITLTKE